MIKKDRDINNLENIICKNREKDSQMLILKKDLIEKEKLIKDFQNKLIIANNDLKTSQNFNEERMKQFYNHNKNNNKSSDIFSFVINKIQNIILFLDSKENFDNKNINSEDNIVEIKENYILFDLLEQNISILKSKIKNRYNFILKQNEENKNKLQIIKKKNEELILTLQKVKNNYNQKLEDLSQKINKLEQSLQSKNDEIKQMNLELKSGTLSKDIFNNFYNNIVSKNIIDFLNEKIKNLNKFVKEYDEYKVKVNNIINQKFNKSNEQIEDVKELQNNIQELNALLNQSNIYLNKTRNENKQLKKRILNLEKAINMISRNNISKNNESKYLLTYNNDNNRNFNILLEE